MPPQVNLIAAVGKRGQLGLGGKIPWRDPDDLRWFRQMTMGHVVVMGAKTWHHLREGRPIFTTLPGRTMCVVSREIYGSADPNFVIHRYPDRQIWVAGGAYVYSIWLPYVRRCFITLSDYDGDADVWMPPLWGEAHNV